MSDPHRLAAAPTVHDIRSSSLTTAQVTEACLEQIDRHDPRLRAWVHVDAAGARKAAAALDDEAHTGRTRGPLHGVPLAVKDIFDVAGVVTTSGAPPFAHRRPDHDAAAVASLRAAGAVILGKTVTTPFAFADPSPTRNPWNTDHTPGGSSSGSAAAVAVGMAPVALGSQTIGSTIRPAAYCGIVGFKATYGLISTEGATPLSWSLDHVGIFARAVEDVALVFSVLAATPGTAPTDAAPHSGAPHSGAPPRLAVPRDWIEKIASSGIGDHVDAVGRQFANAGATVEEVSLPQSAAGIDNAGRLILRVEAAAYHSHWFAAHAAEFAPKIRELIESGLPVSAVDYLRAHEARYGFRREMGGIFERYDALLLPSAPATAPPLSEGTTGDPIFCAPWSFAGFPALALPSGLSPAGLPLSIQLVGPMAADERLLEVARWCESQLDFRASPPLLKLT